MFEGMGSVTRFVSSPWDRDCQFPLTLSPIWVDCFFPVLYGTQQGLDQFNHGWARLSLVPHKYPPICTTIAAHPKLGEDIRPQTLQALAEGTKGQWNRSPIVDARPAAFGVEAGADLDGGRWTQKVPDSG